VRLDQNHSPSAHDAAKQKTPHERLTPKSSPHRTSPKSVARQCPAHLARRSHGMEQHLSIPSMKVLDHRFSLRGRRFTWAMNGADRAGCHGSATGRDQGRARRHWPDSLPHAHWHRRPFRDGEIKTCHVKYPSSWRPNGSATGRQM